MRTIVIAAAVLSACFLQEVNGSFLRKTAPKGKGEEGDVELKEDKKEVKAEAKAEKKSEKKGEKQEEKKEQHEKGPVDNFMDEVVDQADPEFDMASGGDGCLSLEDALEITMAMLQNDAPANADVMSGTKLKKKLSAAQNAQLEAMKAYFHKVDRNKDGCVNRAEFKLAGEFETPLVLNKCDDACKKRLKPVVDKLAAAAKALRTAKATAEADHTAHSQIKKHSESYEKDFQRTAEKAKDLAAEAAKAGASSKAKEAAMQASKDMGFAKAKFQESKDAQADAKAAAKKSLAAQKSAKKNEAKMREQLKQFKAKAKQAAEEAVAQQEQMVFNSADHNGDGFVSWPEAVHFVGENMPHADLSYATLQNMFAAADVDKDEYLSQTEFTAAGKRYKGDGPGLFQVAGTPSLLQAARAMVQYWYPTRLLAPDDRRLRGNMKDEVQDHMMNAILVNMDPKSKK